MFLWTCAVAHYNQTKPADMARQLVYYLKMIIFTVLQNCLYALASCIVRPFFRDRSPLEVYVSIDRWRQHHTVRH